MSTILTDDANERLRALYRVKLVEAERIIAEIQASPVPADDRLKDLRRKSLTRWANRALEYRRQVGG